MRSPITLSALVLLLAAASPARGVPRRPPSRSGSSRSRRNSMASGSSSTSTLTSRSTSSSPTKTGRDVALGDYFGKDRPVILTLVYYSCPMLCTLVLNGMVDALKQIDMVPGKDFEIVSVSFDPTETPTLAKFKKQNYLNDYGRPEAAAGWHFLVGQPEPIRQTHRRGRLWVQVERGTEAVRPPGGDLRPHAGRAAVTLSLRRHVRPPDAQALAARSRQGEDRIDARPDRPLLLPLRPVLGKVRRRRDADHATWRVRSRS